MREDKVVYREPGQVFDGLTLGRARAINDALIGRRVVVVAGADWANIWSERREMMFLRMTLPGERAPTPFSTAWECIFYYYDAESRRACPGSARHTGIALIERLTVVKAPELCPCHECGCWYAQGDLRDTGKYWDWDGVESRLECRPCRESDY